MTPGHLAFETWSVSMGIPNPKWASLSENERTAWELAAKFVRDDLLNEMTENLQRMKAKQW